MTETKALTELEERIRALPEKTRRHLFLNDLTALTHKYGLKIGSCGCCESPWVVPTKEEDAGKHYSTYSEGGYLDLRTTADIEEQEWWKKDEENEWQRETAAYGTSPF